MAWFSKPAPTAQTKPSQEEEKMDHIEMVEKLRARANVSYEEARAALERSNWDLLDAMIELEKQGRIRSDGAAYDTAGKGQDYEPVNATASKQEKHAGFSNFVSWCKALLHKSWVNTFRVSNKDEKVVEMPILLFALLILFGFWIALPLLIIGLFCGCRYAFAGEDIKSDEVNRVMSKATDYAEDIRESVKQSAEKDTNTEETQN